MAKFLQRCDQRCGCCRDFPPGLSLGGRVAPCRSRAPALFLDRNFIYEALFSPRQPNVSIATTVGLHVAAAKTAAPAPARPYRHHHRISRRECLSGRVYHFGDHLSLRRPSSIRRPPSPTYLLHRHRRCHRHRYRFLLVVFLEALGCRRLQSTNCCPPATIPYRPT